MIIQFVVFDERFLDLSWKWLNDPIVKELTSTPDFNKEFQFAWFESLNRKTDYLIWGVLADQVPIGVCGLKNIIKSDGEYWGYIGEKSYWGRGIGSQIMAFTENRARKLGLKSIWLQVKKINERAIGLYIKHGYCIEKQSQGMLFMRKHFSEAQNPEIDPQPENV